MQVQDLSRTIVTVGELIEVLKQYNLTARITFSTSGSYTDNIQLSRDDIDYAEDDTEDHVIVVL